MELKTAYAVFEVEYEEQPELVIVFEREKEANEYRDKYNEVHKASLVHYFVNPVPFKTKEIW